MEVLGRVRLSFWVAVLGAIVLYVFFTGLAGIAPAQVTSLAIAVGALTVLFTLRTLRVASELGARGGDPSVRVARNRTRERRGF